MKTLSAKFTRWSNTFKQFVGNLPTNCLSVLDHFGGLVLKGLNPMAKKEDGGCRMLGLKWLSALFHLDVSRRT